MLCLLHYRRDGYCPDDESASASSGSYSDESASAWSSDGDISDNDTADAVATNAQGGLLATGIAHGIVTAPGPLAGPPPPPPPPPPPSSSFAEQLAAVMQAFEVNKYSLHLHILHSTWRCIVLLH